MTSEPNLLYCTGADVAGQKAKLDVSEICHPLSVELKRWKQFSAFSEQSEKGTIELHKPPPRDMGPSSSVKVGGLVNFPKYMLIHNCHLKSTDQVRYVREEAAKREEAEQRARLGESQSMASLGASNASGFGATEERTHKAAMYSQPSWGSPTLRIKGGQHCAGSSLPAGRGSRTSNPFRQG
jgi:hypothetical protein